MEVQISESYIVQNGKLYSFEALDPILLWALFNIYYVYEGGSIST